MNEEQNNSKEEPKTRARKNKEIKDHLESIELLLAGILINKKPDIKKVAKITRCSDKKITRYFPTKDNPKNKKQDTENGAK